MPRPRSRLSILIPLLLTAAILALWLSSYSPRLLFSHAASPTEHHFLYSSRGQLHFITQSVLPPPDSAHTIDVSKLGSIQIAQANEIAVMSFAPAAPSPLSTTGFQYNNSFGGMRLNGTTFRTRIRVLSLPYWPLTLATASLAAFAIHRARRRPDPALCRHCSYNLTANTSGICPECGTPIQGQNPPRLDRQPPHPSPT